MKSKIPDWFAKTRIGRAMVAEEERGEQRSSSRETLAAELIELRNDADEAQYEELSAAQAELAALAESHRVWRAARRRVRWAQQGLTARRAARRRQIVKNEAVLQRGADPRLAAVHKRLGACMHHQLWEHGSGRGAGRHVHPEAASIRAWEGIPDDKLQNHLRTYKDVAVVKATRSRIQHRETVVWPYMDAFTAALRVVEAQFAMAAPNLQELRRVIRSLPAAPCACSPGPPTLEMVGFDKEPALDPELVRAFQGVA